MRAGGQTCLSAGTPDQMSARQQECLSGLRAFVTGAVVITLIGVAIQPLIYVDRALAADLLRYYWFRLTDVALPLGVALEGTALMAGLLAVAAF